MTVRKQQCKTWCCIVTLRDSWMCEVMWSCSSIMLCTCGWIHRGSADQLSVRSSWQLQLWFEFKTGEKKATVCLETTMASPQKKHRKCTFISVKLEQRTATFAMIHHLDPLLVALSYCWSDWLRSDCDRQWQPDGLSSQFLKYCFKLPAIFPKQFQRMIS